MARPLVLGERPARRAPPSPPAEAAEPPRWLAVEGAGARLLLPLRDAGEIVEPTPVPLALPHAQPWFEGVVNLRGRLHGVVDLAAFLGLRAPLPRGARAGTRLLSLHPALGLACALRLERLAGLRHAAQLLAPGEGAVPPVAQPAFAAEVRHDAQGHAWQVLDLAALARDMRFLDVADPDRPGGA